MSMPKSVRTVGIVSLSSGILGENFVQHEVECGMRRLRRRGLDVRFLPNARRGTDFLRAHPECRAADLLTAFRDPDIDLILCAIGGDDTYRLAPYLFENNALRDALSDKLCLGFSDTTINHLMLHKMGLPTFYGQSFLPDVCELSHDMLPYTMRYFDELLETGTIREVTPSPVWYESRTDFSPRQLGKTLPVHPNVPFTLLQGAPRFTGKLLGGCLDSLFDLFDGTRYPDMPEICARYGLFPPAREWRGKILLLETSEEQMPPEKFRRALEYLRDAGVFDAVSGVLLGKPMDERYDAEYRRLLLDVIGNPALPVLCNLSVGHALPRCILPFGVDAEVDAEAQRIRFRP